MGLFLIWLCVNKKKGKEGSQVVNESPKPLEAFSDYFQPSFAQNKEVRTVDNVAYSTQLQVLQDKRE